jgi:hypothetical protein
VDRHRFTVIAEPRDETYYELLVAAARSCSSASLVVHSNKTYDATAHALLESLGSEVLQVVTTREWPGTMLSEGHSAEQWTFRLTESTSGQLRTAARGLYDWRMPKLPDDLSFWREDGTLWLGSTAHEQDAFMELAPRELGELTETSPMVVSLLRKDMRF